MTFPRLIGSVMAIVCILMTLGGLVGYSGIEMSFQKPPSETQTLYTHYYFVPYIVLSGVFVTYVFVGWNRVLRIWLSSVCLGASVFGFIFIPMSNVGHDFSHIFLKECGSTKIDIFIGTINACLIISSLFLVILGIREYRTKKIS